MVKVSYYTQVIEFSQKTQKVLYLFKRLPTKEQLEAFEKQTKEPQHPMTMSGKSFGNIFRMFEHTELELNWDNVKLVVTKKQAYDTDLKIGDVVQLDIPEEVTDIMVTT